VNSTTTGRGNFIWICATGKSGLGHLRRCTSIAAEMRRISPAAGIGLLTNAPPAGLPERDLAVWSRVGIAPREEMAGFMGGQDGVGAAVVDTAVLPGLERLSAPVALILRETPEDRLARFAMPGGRPWDAVVVPNPADHWLPDGDTVPCRHLEAVGWIYRALEASARSRPGSHVLVATGGGGTEETARALRELLDPVLTAAREFAKQPFEVAQAIGPRAPANAKLLSADRTIDPGGDLNVHFAEARAVISTAGYNSVLELAGLDVPTMLAAIPRSFDDQTARARLWGPRLGHFLGHDIGSAARWLADAAARGERRVPWDLGPSGAGRAAQLLLELAN